MRTTSGAVLALLVVAVSLAGAPGAAQARPAATASGSAHKSTAHRAHARTARSPKTVVSGTPRQAPPPRPKEPQTVAEDAAPAEGSLILASAAATIVDQASGEVLFEKREQDSKPIASLAILMTALVVLEAGQPLQEVLDVTAHDVESAESARLRAGFRGTRSQLLLFALVGSEHPAAFALARHYPGGPAALVRAMNATAARLGMSDTVFRDPVGTDPGTVSTARDLSLLVRAAYGTETLRQLSTTTSCEVADGPAALAFHNANPLLRGDVWHIGVSKTGSTRNERGSLIMQAVLAGRPVIVVLLDSQGPSNRIGDAVRVWRWLERTARNAAKAGSEARPEAISGVSASAGN